MGENLGAYRVRIRSHIRHNRAIASAFAKQAYHTVQPDIVFCCLPTLELAEKSVQFGQKINAPVIVDIRDLWPDLYPKLRVNYDRLGIPRKRICFRAIVYPTDYGLHSKRQVPWRSVLTS